jgi:hypothetical protein
VRGRCNRRLDELAHLDIGRIAGAAVGAAFDLAPAAGPSPGPGRSSCPRRRSARDRPAPPGRSGRCPAHHRSTTGADRPRANSAPGLSPGTRRRGRPRRENRASHRPGLRLRRKPPLRKPTKPNIGPRDSSDIFSHLSPTVAVASSGGPDPTSCACRRKTAQHRG